MNLTTHYLSQVFNASHTRLLVGSPQHGTNICSERTGNNMNGCKDFHLQPEAMIWSRLSNRCRILSTAVPERAGYRRPTPSLSLWLTLSLSFSLTDFLPLSQVFNASHTRLLVGSPQHGTKTSTVSFRVNSERLQWCRGLSSENPGHNLVPTV